MRNEKKKREIAYSLYGWPQSSTPSMQVAPQIVSVAFGATRADTPPIRAAASIARLVAIMLLGGD